MGCCRLAGLFTFLSPGSNPAVYVATAITNLWTPAQNEMSAQDTLNAASSEQPIYFYIAFSRPKSNSCISTASRIANVGHTTTWNSLGNSEHGNDDLGWVCARSPNDLDEGHEEFVEKADSTLRSSQAVPHPSTNRALCCLTSEVKRDPVHSMRYGRRRRLKLLRSLALEYRPAQLLAGCWPLDVTAAHHVSMRQPGGVVACLSLEA